MYSPQKDNQGNRICLLINLIYGFWSKTIYRDFSIRIARLPTLARDTRTDGGLGEGGAESLVDEGFDRIGLFQRYPNILETGQEGFQQFNKNIEYDVSI